MSSVRDSFTPNVDGFDEENGKRERGKFVKKVSRFEESSYVKRTSQFYCPTPSEVESLDANCNKSQRQKQLQQLLQSHINVTTAASGLFCIHGRMYEKCW